MSRATRNLLILALVAAALIATVLAIGRRDYVRDPPTLTALDPDTVTRIELTVPSVASKAFVRSPGGEWSAASNGARADSERVQRLARLAAAPVVRWLPGAEVTPAKVGLAHPSATLVVDGHRLEYGGLTALDDLRYVRVGDKVALVPRQYSPEVVLTKGGD